MFALCRAGKSIYVGGVKRRLVPGSVDTLEARVRAFFAEGAAGRDPERDPGVLVGALPFDLDRDDLLFQPDLFHHAHDIKPFTPLSPDGGARGWAPRGIAAAPPPARYAEMVRRALARIAAGELRKVVLARSLRIEASAPVDPAAVAERLSRDPSAATFLVDLSLASGRPGHKLVGATPELLVSREGTRIVSHPLAGSARRVPDAAEDRRAGEALLRSDKDRREHALVVESILDILAPFCAQLAAPEGTGLRSTATMWHLGTRIEGVLKGEGPSAAGLAAMLHPTPAVGGDPRAAALEAIRDLEPHDRGFYAGAVGWTDAQGDGEWYVTLRCAEIEGASLILHAGAGIVAGSDPDAEVAETSAKFRTMLRALDMEEQKEMAEATL